MEVVDKLFYGVINNPLEPMLINAFLLNTSLNAYFYKRLNKVAYLHYYIILVLLITCGIYFLIPGAMGTSTVWSFLYGFNNNNHIDHLTYWIACLSVFIPYYMDATFNKLFSINMWPWERDYIYICNAAHILFAILGYVMKYRCILKSSKNSFYFT